MGQNLPKLKKVSVEYDEPEPIIEGEDDTWPAEKFPIQMAPKDSEGFIQSFKVDQEDEFTKFFNEFGFVVIDGVLSSEDVEQTLEEIWKLLERDWGTGIEVDRMDPNTWGNSSWPLQIRSLGIVGNEVALGKMAWKNRLNENLYKVFRKLMKKEDLWVSVDRYGVMRPTKGTPPSEAFYGVPPKEVKKQEKEVVEKKKEEKMEEKGEEGEIKEGKKEEKKEEKKDEHPEWKTKELWLHWDLNPWAWTAKSGGKNYVFEGFITENNGSKNTGEMKLQGLINLVESREQDGGFCCVPGFHKHLDAWSEQTKGTIYARKFARMWDFVSVPKKDLMFDQHQKITSRAGSLIVWRSELPHCNYPNDSNRFRMNQYIKMFPQREGFEGTDIRMEMMKEIMPTVDLKLTKLQEKLLGLRKWK